MTRDDQFSYIIYQDRRSHILHRLNPLLSCPPLCPHHERGVEELDFARVQSSLSAPGDRLNKTQSLVGCTA